MESHRAVRPTRSRSPLVVALKTACLRLLPAFAFAHGLLPCPAQHQTRIVSNTNDTSTLATSLQCSNGSFSVRWYGHVIVSHTINVTQGTSLSIHGASGNATADGDQARRLFAVDGASSLNITDMVLANGTAEFGGAVLALEQATVYFGGNMTFTSNTASYGGAIYAKDSTVVGQAGHTVFSNNHALSYGGALMAEGSSDIYWEGETVFSSNSADDQGGAAFANESSDISWSGKTTFASNIASGGGAIYANGAHVVWDGDMTIFRNNSASASDDGGAIRAIGRSNVSWDGDTLFTNNRGFNGGAVLAQGYSNISWKGSTSFLGNYAHFGGAFMADSSSYVSWDGETVFAYNTADTGGAALLQSYSQLSWTGKTSFVENSANDDGGGLALDSACAVAWSGSTTFKKNTAGKEGGGVHVLTNNNVSWTGITTFTGNIAGDKAGALFVSDSVISWTGKTTFAENVAHRLGGAVYAIVSSRILCQGTTVFERNSATTGDGGALALYGSWSGESCHVNISGQATFADNFAFGTGGAMFSSANARGHYFEGVRFITNSAGIGGAVGSYDNGNDVRVLPAPTTFLRCEFNNNMASSSGLAVAVFDSLVDIHETTFNGNAFSCPEGEYLLETPKEAAGTARYEKVCDGCPSWEACMLCNVRDSDLDPVCSTTLEHTSANEGDTTLETLNIDNGYWRATNESVTILACYNPDACVGGQTGTESFCNVGYMGPYCSVCQSGYSLSLSASCTRCSRSRRQWLHLFTVIAGIIAVYSMVVFVDDLVCTEVEERNTTCIQLGVLQRIPLQGFKSVIIVWQILTQFASVANVAYPGVYQTFLSGLDIINLDIRFLTSAGCLWSGIDFHDRLLAGTIWPLVILGLLSMTYAIALRNKSAPDGRVREKIRSEYLSAVMFLLFLVYSSVSSTVFRMFACDSLDDGGLYLRADYRIMCTGAKHRVLQVYAVFMIAVYPIGIPLLFAVLLDRHRDVLSDSGADKSAAQSIANLWAPYRPSRFYYEIVEYGRRIMLTGVVVFIYPNDTAQIAITIVISFLFFLVSEVLSPYKSASDTWLSRCGHVLIFFSMFDVLLLRVDVSQESSDSQQVLSGVLVTGHIVLIFAVVGEAIGLCYASGRAVIVVKEDSPSQRAIRRPSMPIGQEEVGREHAWVVEFVHAPSRGVGRQHR